MTGIGLPVQLDGSLDAVADGFVLGWARNHFHPELTVEVEVLIDGEIVGRSICDRFRDDLVQAGYGTGRYGFSLALPSDFADGRPHVVVARATGTDLVLHGSPLRVQVGEAAVEVERPGPFAADTVLERSGSMAAVRSALAVQGRLAVFATFQRHGSPSQHVRGYLESLRAAGFAVVLVDTSPGGSIGRWSGLGDLVLRRRNVGWDFASWLAGLHAVNEVVDSIDELLLANDSVFGPLFPLDESFTNERISEADFWGITDSWETRYHVQSYFVLLRRQVVQSETLWRFLEHYPFPVAKRQVVRDGEIGLTTALLDAGFRPAVTCPYEVVARHWLDDLPRRIGAVRAMPENAFLDLGALESAVRGQSAAQSLRHILLAAHHIRRGLPVNGSHFFWDTLIETFRCPFMKKDLVLANPAEIPFATDLHAVLAKSTSYPAEWLVEEARMAADPRVATL